MGDNGQAADGDRGPSPATAPASAAAIARPAMAALQAPDAILRPDVLDRIRVFLHQERGTPHEVIRMLSENYRCGGERERESI